MNITAGTAIALVGLTFLTVAFFMLRNAEARLLDAIEARKDARDALNEAKRLNDESAALNNRVTAMLDGGAL